MMMEISLTDLRGKDRLLAEAGLCGEARDLAIHFPLLKAVTEFAA
jgi:hypothetical protein